MMDGMSRGMLRRAMFTLAPTLWPGIGHANDLLGSGWRHGEYPGLRPARFTAIGEQGLRIEGHGTGSFVWRRVSGVAQCLSWRWRVDEGPPPTDLTRRFGDDRAISVAVGFAGFPSRAGPWQRAQHAIAQGAAGNHTLPRSVLIYSWGGTGREPVRFYSPGWANWARCTRCAMPAARPGGGLRSGWILMPIGVRPLAATRRICRRSPSARMWTIQAAGSMLRSTVSESLPAERAPDGP